MSIGRRLFAFAMLAMLAVSVRAAPMERTVLALYDGSAGDRIDGSAVRATLVHRLAEMPLNHLGLKVQYHDISQGLPEPAELEGIRGVFTWFRDDRVPRPRAYMDWAEMALDQGLRYVVMGNPGVSSGGQGPAFRERVTRFYKRLGLVDRDRFVKLTYDVNLLRHEPGMLDFERRYGGQLPGYDQLAVLPDRGRAILEARKAGNSETDATLVAITDVGGYVASGYSHTGGDDAQERQWTLNPFAFLAEALDVVDTPRPDVTTLAGNRIFFSHIDGDGWNNLSGVPGYADPPTLSSRVILEEIVRGFPDLPVTVGPVVAELHPEWHGSETSRAVARAIFSEPNVEAGSHTWSHPLDWGYFADGAPQEMAKYGDLYPEAGWIGEYDPDADRFRLDWSRKRDRKQAMVGEGGEYGMPRAYGVEPFDLEQEITGAVWYINQLTPPDKEVEIVQWSGDTTPFDEAIARAREAGLYNINGGDSRYDRTYPSYSWVAPVGRPVDGERQIYASNSNENTYTDLWTKHFYGFRFLMETVDNTEHPRRVKPFNVYYHMYSGEKLASLNAVKVNLRKARSEGVLPVTTSHYAAIAESFYETRLERSSDDLWEVRNRGALQTVRFDRAATRAVDFSRSEGVLGQRHFQGSLYVALDPEVERPRVALRSLGQLGLPPEAERAYVIQSRWRVSALELETNEGFEFSVRGFGPGRMRWYVPRAGTYAVRIVAGGEVETLQRQAEQDGRLEFVLPARAIEGARVQVARVEGPG